MNYKNQQLYQENSFVSKILCLVAMVYDLTTVRRKPLKMSLKPVSSLVQNVIFPLLMVPTSPESNTLQQY